MLLAACPALPCLIRIHAAGCREAEAKAARAAMRGKSNTALLSFAETAEEEDEEEGGLLLNQGGMGAGGKKFKLRNAAEVLGGGRPVVPAVVLPAAPAAAAAADVSDAAAAATGSVPSKRDLLKERVRAQLARPGPVPRQQKDKEEEEPAAGGRLVHCP